MKKKKVPTDRERLDYLEQFIAKERWLMIHNLNTGALAYSGLGIGPAFKRSLRDAIDRAAGWNK